MILWIIIWILWTIIVLGVGIGAGMQYERDKEHPTYQDGKPVVDEAWFTYTTEGMTPEQKDRLNKLWDWYENELGRRG